MAMSAVLAHPDWLHYEALALADPVYGRGQNVGEGRKHTDGVDAQGRAEEVTEVHGCYSAG